MSDKEASAAPPSEEQTVGVNSPTSTPPRGSQTPPQGSQTPPSGSQTPSSEGEIPREEGFKYNFRLESVTFLNRENQMLKVCSFEGDMPPGTDYIIDIERDLFQADMVPMDIRYRVELKPKNLIVHYSYFLGDTRLRSWYSNLDTEDWESYDTVFVWQLVLYQTKRSQPRDMRVDCREIEMYFEFNEVTDDAKTLLLGRLCIYFKEKYGYDSPKEGNSEDDKTSVSSENMVLPKARLRLEFPGFSGNYY